ncbi:hypothetical protein [Actinosynnema sp.]|uniref:hypothetical protein n=1 Tax=Actinosynnema sp. TaxID=1872144 RepID=UPI003F85B760
MTDDLFVDRLDAATYEDDDGRVGIFETEPSDPDAVWLSDRLFWRLRHVAVAYELHTLPLLGGSEPVELNRPMCQSLLDELGFVSDRLNDAVAASTAQAIADYLVVRLRRPRWDGSVTVEGD